MMSAAAAGSGSPASRRAGKRGSTTFSRDRVRWARDKGLLIYRTLREERNRVQIDGIQRGHFGEWSDVFSSLARCRGRVMVCLLGRTVIAYQAFEPFAVKGSPFSEDKLVMRFTYVFVREDRQVKARGLGIGRELIGHTLEMAWDREYDAVYSYVTAYELLEECGFVSMAGKGVVAEAKHIRDFDPDQAPPLLYYIENPAPLRG